jgi:outer membrane lipoprotein-sorting protein
MERVTKGTATFKKGGRVRWSYEGDDPQEIVCDGATLWVHQVRDRTVIKRKVSELSPAGRVALDLLGGFEGVSEQFTLGSCGERCVELTPRRPDPDLAKVRVELAREGGAVASVSTEDPVGNVTKVEFSDLRTNTGVSDAAFAFTPPSGTDVVESGLEAPK